MNIHDIPKAAWMLNELLGRDTIRAFWEYVDDDLPHLSYTQKKEAFFSLLRYCLNKGYIKLAGAYTQAHGFDIWEGPPDEVLRQLDEWMPKDYGWEDDATWFFFNFRYCFIHWFTNGPIVLEED